MAFSDQIYLGEELPLLNCPIQLHANEVLTIAGYVEITTHKFHYTPGPVERFLWNEELVSVNLDITEIKSIKIVGMRRRLELKTQDQTWMFAGQKAIEVYGAIKSVLDCHVINISPEEFIYEVWPGYLFGDPLASLGEIIITTHQLSFVTVSSMDSLTGIQETVHVPLKSIERIQARGGLEPRLILSCKSKTYEFKISKCLQRYQWLARIYRDVMKRVIFSQRHHKSGQIEAPLEKIQTRLEAWSGCSEETRAEDMGIFIAALYLDERHEAQLGWIGSVNQYIIWFPGKLENVQQEPLVIPLKELQHKASTEIGAISALWNDVTITFLPLSGVEGVDHFWHQHGTVMVPSNGSVRKRSLNNIGDVDINNRRDTFRVKIFDNPMGIRAPETEEDNEQYQWKFYAGSPLKPFKGDLQNLSMGGCGLQSFQKLPLNSPFSLYFFNENQEVTIPGVVVFSNELVEKTWSIGIKFDELSPENQELLRDVWMTFQREMMLRNVK